MADAVPYPHGSVPSSGRLTEVRASVAATFDKVKEKPKRTREYIEALLEKLPELSVSESEATVSRDPVITFIRSVRGMPLEAIGEWLGQPGNEPEVEKYVATFDLGNLNIEEEYQSTVFQSIRSQSILTPKSDSLWAAPVWVRLVDKQFRSTEEAAAPVSDIMDKTLLEARRHEDITY